METLIGILQDQREVKYLTYFILQNRLGVIILKLGTCGVSKEYKFRNESAGLVKIVEILLDLKNREARALKRAEKENGNVNRRF